MLASAPVVGLLLLQLLPLVPSGPRPSVELVYSRSAGAETCPALGALQQSVSDRLGYNPFQASADRRISVAIVRIGAELTAKLSVVSIDGDFLGTQELAGAPIDCLDLAGALSLSLSLAIDPRSLDATAAPEPEPGPRRSLVAAGIPARPWRPAPESHWRGILGLSTALGAAPVPAAGAHAGAQFRGGRFSIEMAARADLPVQSQAIAGPFANSLLVAELAPCYRPLWTFDICALALGGLDLSRDSGQVARHSSTDPYAAAGGRLSAELITLAPLALRASADLLVPLIRRRFIVDLASGPGGIWSTPPVQGVLGLDLVTGF